MTYTVETVDVLSDTPHAVRAFENVSLYPGREFISEIVNTQNIRLLIIEDDFAIGEANPDGTEISFEQPNAVPFFERQTAATRLFDDINPDNWFYRYVNTVTNARLFQGTSSRIFSPQQSMTRAMFAQVLANLEGVDTTIFTNSSFNDVPTNTWYFGAVEWASQMGIVQGIGNNNFAPNVPITREQMAVILYRYAEIMGIEFVEDTATAFADQALISSWVVNAVNEIQSASIVTGRPDGRFDPQATATRAEVATIFARFLEVAQ